MLSTNERVLRFYDPEDQPLDNGDVLVLDRVCRLLVERFDSLFKVSWDVLFDCQRIKIGEIVGVTLLGGSDGAGDFVHGGAVEDRDILALGYHVLEVLAHKLLEPIDFLSDI